MLNFGKTRVKYHALNSLKHDRLINLIFAPFLLPHHRQTSIKPSSKFFWAATLALMGFTLCAEDLIEAVKPSESDDPVTVQSNGYFEFSTEHRLNNDVVSYGDLVVIIDQLTKEKLSAFRIEEKSQSQETKITTSALNEKPVSIRTERTWKRRILVFLDGERVTGTADQSMKIEDHLGSSLDAIKSLEGFLSTDIEASERAFPRVLNFVSETPDLHETDSNESNDLESKKTQS